MDLYTPEIACQCGDNQTGIPSTAITDGSGVDLAKNVTAARAYDELHVQAVLNQISGKHSSGNYAAQIPNLFGLNFQAVSVGQKVISTHCLFWLVSFNLFFNLNNWSVLVGLHAATTAGTQHAFMSCRRTHAKPLDQNPVCRTPASLNIMPTMHQSSVSETTCCNY